MSGSMKATSDAARATAANGMRWAARQRKEYRVYLDVTAAAAIQVTRVAKSCPQTRVSRRIEKTVATRATAVATSLTTSR